MKKWLVIIAIVVVFAAAYLITMSVLNGQVKAAYAAKKAAGQPTTLAELPKHQDASGGEAARMLAEAQGALDTTTDKTAFDRADSNQLSPEETRTFLARNARPLQLLMAVSRYPAQSLFPKLEEGAAARIEMTLHSWPKFFTLLHAQARDLIAQNKGDEAMDVCLAGLRITDLLATDQMAFYVLVQFRFDRATMAVMQDVAPHCSDAALAKAAAAVAGLRADKDLVPAWSAEGVVFANMLEKPSRTELAIWGMDNAPGMLFYMFPPTNRLSLIEYLRVSRRCIELTMQPWYRSRAAWDSMAAADKQLEDRRAPLSYVHLGKASLIPARIAQYQAMRAVTLAGLRLLQYERAHGGVPPAELSAAGTDFGVDPCTGKPLTYHVEGAKVKLYSVGADLKDDGGDPKTDIIWNAGS